MGIVDGPTEVHKIAVAKELLRDRKAAAGMFPDYYLPNCIDHARQKLAHALELDIGNL
jgi:acyl-CoA dehydrogenase